MEEIITVPGEISPENQKIKENWISALNDLAGCVESWFLQEDKDINISRAYIDKEEDYIGQYTAPVLYFTSNKACAELRPAGRFAFGSIGRVDLTDGKRFYAFLYSRNKGWIFMDNRKPLTKELFFEILEKLL